MYTEVSAVEGLKSQSMLHWLAQQGKSEWIQWFLQVQPPRVLENDRHSRVLAAALGSAACGNHQKIFFEIAKYFEHKPRKLCNTSASVEDGLPRLVACWPSLDLQSTLSQEVSYSWLHEKNVGPWLYGERSKKAEAQMFKCCWNEVCELLAVSGSIAVITTNIGLHSQPYRRCLSTTLIQCLH
jgi:hypothetical protein